MGRSLGMILAGGAMIAAAPLAGSARAQGTYFELFGGWTIPQSHDFTLDTPDGELSSGLDFDSGYAVGLAFGFAYSPNLGIEAEYVYRNADADLGGTEDSVSGSTKSNAFMVNAVYDFVPAGAPDTLRPYAGLGLGVGDLSVDMDGEKLDSDYGFAYQAMLGLGYETSPEARLFGEIRYFAIADKTLENDDASFESGFDTVDVLFGYQYRF